MNRSPQFASFLQGRGWRSMLVLAFLVCAGLTPILRAQSSTPASGPAASAALPDDPSIAAAAANSVTPNSSQGSLPIFDPFKPRPRFGIAASPGSMGLNGAAFAFGENAPSQGGPRQSGNPGFGAGMGVQQRNLATFFPTDGLAAAPAKGAYWAFGATPAAPSTVPTLNELMRANLRAPLGSSSANFRLSYQERFGTIGSSNASDFSHMLATGMFTSADLGNGVLFSAGTGHGGHMAGAPAATLGNGTGAPKHSGSSLDIKLSF